MSFKYYYLILMILVKIIHSFAQLNGFKYGHVLQAIQLNISYIFYT